MSAQKKLDNASLTKTQLKDNIHLMGISGIGMKGLLHILLNLNYSVSGSDLYLDKQLTSLINEKNLFASHHPSHIHKDIQTLIYSAAIPTLNCELQEAKKKGILCLSRGDALAQIATLAKTCIAISGTHGKTTTAACISHLLKQADYDPGYYIGGIPQNNFPQAYFNHNKFFVVETDESDGSFLNIPASINAIINIDNDHLSYYTHFHHLLAAFETKIKQCIQKENTLIINCNNKYLNELCQKNKAPIFSVGYHSQADLSAKNITFTKQGLNMDLFLHGHFQENISCPLYGEHNIENILISIAIALQVGLSISEIKIGLSTFLGTKKRFEFLKNDQPIILDYAHHPTAIKATLKAYKKHFDTPICAIFQPHRYSRLNDYFDDFVDALSLAESLCILPVFSAQETDAYPLNHTHLIAALKQKPNCTNILNSIEELFQNQRKKTSPLLFMGAGDIDQFAYDYVKKHQHQTTLSSIKPTY